MAKSRPPVPSTTWLLIKTVHSYCKINSIRPKLTAVKKSLKEWANKIKDKWEKEAWETQSNPRLQQLIQLYCYLYITDTLYSGEITGRIIHIILCDSPQGHKYWCGRPERGEESSLKGEGYVLYTLPFTNRPLPVRGQSVCIPTCTYGDSPRGALLPR